MLFATILTAALTMGAAAAPTGILPQDIVCIRHPLKRPGRQAYGGRRRYRLPRLIQTDNGRGCHRLLQCLQERCKGGRHSLSRLLQTRSDGEYLRLQMHLSGRRRRVLLLDWAHTQYRGEGRC